MNNTPASDNPLVDSVMSRIKTEKILPRSRAYFLVQNYGIWFLWLLTMIIGAMAVAVSLFTLVYRYLDIHEAIRETFWLYSFEVLPYIWLLLVVLMAIFAVYNLRHTNHGYRYSLANLVASSLIGSLGGGIVLYVFGFGFLIDSALGTYLVSYDSQDKVEQYLWQEPKDGRLIGNLLVERVDYDGQFNFIDSNSFLWYLNTEELTPESLKLLNSGAPVRLLGLVTGEEQPIFLVCEVLPVRAGRDHSIKELFDERDLWLEKMFANYKILSGGPKGLCSEAIFVRRLGTMLP